MTSASLPTLRHWLGRHYAGDAGAREEVLRACQTWLERLIARSLGRFPRVRGREESCDICQNVLLRLDRLLRRRAFATEGDFLRAAARSVWRELIDLSRKHSAKTVSYFADRFGWRDCRTSERGDLSQDPYTLVRWHEVHGLIAALPAADRRLFDLLYYEGLTQPEAAVRLQISLRTLKRNWHDTRARLRLAFGNDSPF